MAQHAMSVSSLEVARCCLLHDAGEAYISDVVRPLKRQLGWISAASENRTTFATFREVEEKIMETIADKFGLPWPFPPEVDELDLRMLAARHRDLFDDRQTAWAELAGVEPLPITVYPPPPFTVRACFIAPFELLFGKGK